MVHTNFQPKKELYKHGWLNMAALNVKFPIPRAAAQNTNIKR